MSPSTQDLPREDDVLLRNGVIARLRPLRSIDREAIVALHHGLSERSRYLRFFSLGLHGADEFVDRLFHYAEAGEAWAYVALVHDEIVGLGSTIRVSESAAEMAFAVSDDMHDLGIATLLLERLAAAAERSGIREFVSSELTTNSAMLDVIRMSGFDANMSRDHEVVEVRFPVHLTDRLREAIGERERRNDVASVDSLLGPRSVAVIGASRRAGSPGATVFTNLVDGDFSGAVYPVNPSAAEIHGVTSYGSVLDVPGDVDLAIVAVPADAVIPVVRDCAAKRVRSVVVLSSGFAEAGAEGQARQDELLRVVRAGDMRLVGPNCLGVANTDPAVRLDATFATTGVIPGAVGLMTQSGAVGIAVLRRAEELGIGLSAFVSAGNKADISGNDMLMYFDDDARTRVVALYLESFGNPRKFSRLARHVGRNKPVVALVGGASRAGRRAATGHTAAAVTSDTAVDALFGQCGVVRARSLEHFLHVTSLFAHQELPRGRRVAVVSNGGGPAVLAVDALAAAGVELAELDPSTTAKIRGTVRDVAGAANPVDLGSGASAADLASVLEDVARDPGVDAVVAVHTPVPGLDGDAFAQAAGSVSDVLAAKPVVAVMIGERAGRPPIAGSRNAIPVFGFPEDAAQALASVIDYVAWRERAPGEVPDLNVRTQQARDLVTRRLLENPGGCRLDAVDTRHLLDCYGISTVEAVGASGATSAVDAANWVGYPVVMKVASAELVHKSDVGGVRVGINDAAAVIEAYQEMEPVLAGLHRPGVLIQRQVKPGVELIVGVSQDPLFGPLVMLGTGGTSTELFADHVFSMTPLTDADTARAVRGLRGSPLLFGYRGTTPVDVDAVERLLLRVGRLADDLPQVAEIDLNPVIASETGIAIVDAKIRLHPARDLADPALPRLRPPLGTGAPSEPQEGRVS
ncbi:MAG: GNAT family N-acetyltransferase [Streptosporangiales bacterium]|nr:GNAT family N-acetyltransferase [Streptosporangiales bacterium]